MDHSCHNFFEKFDYYPCFEFAIRCKRDVGRWSAFWILSDFLLKIEVERHCCTSSLDQVLKPETLLAFKFVIRQCVTTYLTLFLKYFPLPGNES